jgi:hypothetical protein
VSLGLTSYYGSLTYASLVPQFANLTNFCVFRAIICDFTGPFPRLRCLQFASQYIGYVMMGGGRDLVLAAPCLEQITIHTANTTWGRLSSYEDVLPHVRNLSTLPHLQHIKMLFPDSCSEEFTPAVVTRILLTGMLASRCWRQVTSHMVPAPIRISDNDEADNVLLLSQVQWHVITPGQKQVDVYLPLIHVSWWRAWVPGLQAKQIVWELCLLCR